MRLNKFLSSCGLGSRRGVEAVILEGRVRINGQVCTSLATSVEPGDEVQVDNKKMRPGKPVVLALHKPKGYVCTRDDERERRTIYDLLPAKLRTLAHVGRLDMDSEGLMLMTNQGDLAHRLAHPTHGLEKEYEVMLDRPFNPAHLDKLTHGLHIEEGFAKAERAWIIGHYKLGIVLKQGLKRQIRHMLYRVGYEVKRLVRVRIGNLALTGLAEGAWRELKESEVDRLLVNPKPKDRPRLSKPTSASSRKALTERLEREKEEARDKENAAGQGQTGGMKGAGRRPGAPSSRSAGMAGPAAEPGSRARSGRPARGSSDDRGKADVPASRKSAARKRPARKTSRRGGARGGY